MMKFFTPALDKKAQRRLLRTQQELENGDVNSANSTNGGERKKDTRVIDIITKTDPNKLNTKK